MQGATVELIESHCETYYVDVFEPDGSPADLSSAQAFFHLMEFSTRDHIWTKACEPVLDVRAAAQGAAFPSTVPVHFAGGDTLGLDGHYTGQLELVDHNGGSKFPLQVELIVNKRASR